MEDLRIFDFERDFEGSLRCIPMVVRFKLDHCGVKLTLRQWSRFSVDERRQLVERPCAQADDIAAYGQWLRALIGLRAGEVAQDAPLDPRPAWRDTTEVPLPVDHQARQRGLLPPTQERWARLTPLQRFVLLKLTRAGHDNANFVPALQEFGACPV